MLFNNDKAVSPIVATLVLIVVAIAGAAAVGTIMGSFSSDVSDSASADQAASSASTELLIAGSTTVQPVSEKLAEAYMEEHSGVKVTVQGGGSGAGVSSTGMDIVDIGAASRAVKDTELTTYPDLQTYQIGASAVVVIANENAMTDFNCSKEELEDLFLNDTSDSSGNFSDDIVPYQRAEESGTEDTFTEYLGGKDASINSSIKGATGNAGVLEAVQDDDNGVGFVDYGYADGADGIKILGIYDGKMYYPVDSDAIKDELGATGSNEGKYYPHGLTRPLNYITNGNPTSMEKAFIDFARSPGATQYFDEVGYFSITSI